REKRLRQHGAQQLFGKCQDDQAPADTPAQDIKGVALQEVGHMPPAAEQGVAGVGPPPDTVEEERDPYKLEVLTHDQWRETDQWSQQESSQDKADQAEARILGIDTIGQGKRNYDLGESEEVAQQVGGHLEIGREQLTQDATDQEGYGHVYGEHQR